MEHHFLSGALHHGANCGKNGYAVAADLPAAAPPPYLRQREQGRPDRAFVILNGKRCHLGRYGSPASRQRYAELVLGAAPAAAAELPPSADATLVTLMARYYRWAALEYGPKHPELHHFKGAFRVVRDTCGELRAAEFGPKMFGRVREAMIAKGWSRGYINEQGARLKRFIGWCVAEELLPGTVHHALQAVRPLRRSAKCKARETEPVRPVAADVIAATKPHCAAVVQDMIDLMLFTGMRPAELCELRPQDVDRSGAVWFYVPQRHKCQVHGKSRRVAIGPKAQAVLAKYLLADKPFGYTSASFRRHIHRACAAAGVAKWSPNQLRHNAATLIRQELGLDHVAAALGHSNVATSQIYAELSAAKAAEAALRVG